jgi:hypothetical protein
MESTICAKVDRCFLLFRLLIHPPSALRLSFSDPDIVLQLEDERSRFRVWSKNLRADVVGIGSLDYRLRDASHLKTQVINLLEDLAQFLRDTRAIARGEQTLWDQQPEEPDDEGVGNTVQDAMLAATELSQIAKGIADVVDCLHSLAVAIRNPAPHDRYVKVKSADGSPTEAARDIQHVSSMFPLTEPSLARRLGTAITRRRHYLRSCQSRHKRLAAGLDQEPDTETAPEDEIVVHPVSGHIEGSRASSSQPPLRRLPLDVDIGLRTPNSSVADQWTGFAIPPMPQDSYDGPFQCLFCDVTFLVRDQAIWK